MDRVREQHAVALDGDISNARRAELVAHVARRRLVGWRARDVRCARQLLQVSADARWARASHEHAEPVRLRRDVIIARSLLDRQRHRQRDHLYTFVRAWMIASPAF